MFKMNILTFRVVWHSKRYLTAQEIINKFEIDKTFLINVQINNKFL